MKQLVKKLKSKPKVNSNRIFITPELKVNAKASDLMTGQIFV